MHHSSLISLKRNSIFIFCQFYSRHTEIRIFQARKFTYDDVRVSYPAVARENEITKSGSAQPSSVRIQYISECSFSIDV